jgi:hypothetical protein
LKRRLTLVAVNIACLLALSATAAFAQNPPNGDFESGVLGPWVRTQDPGMNVDVVTNNSTIPPAGVYGAEFVSGLPGDAANNMATISQVVTLPAGSKFITFDYNMLRADTSGSGDVFSADITGTGGSVSLVSRSSLSGKTGGWVRQQVDLSNLAGGSYVLSFKLTSDGNRRTTRVGLDNVNIVPAPPALIAFALGAGTTGLMGLRRRMRK